MENEIVVKVKFNNAEIKIIGPLLRDGVCFLKSGWIEKIWHASYSRRVLEIFQEIDVFGEFEFNDEDRSLFTDAIEWGINYRKISESVSAVDQKIYDKVEAISDMMYDLEVKAGMNN